ncbi:MAG: sigma 54-interacting transcriptional regulator, partial [Desulfobulbaceae bacterium]|nr:sigma 54-interacting transcriptional regulator [Desulfobulbaceae bacterium]
HEQEVRIDSMLGSNYLPGLPLEQQRQLLSRFLRAIKDEKHGAVFSAISLLDDQGREVVRISDTTLVDQDDLLNMAEADEFTMPATTGQSYYSPIYFDVLTGEPMMKISVPMRDLHDLRLKGVLVTEMTLKSMRHLVAAMRIGRDGTAYITDQQGRLVAHPNRSLVLRNVHFEAPDIPTIMEGIAGDKAVVAAEKIHFGNQTMFFITEIPTAEALRHIHRSLFILSSFLVFLLIGSVVLGFIVVRQIIRPIESLAETAKNISQGDFSQKAKSKRMDEIGELAMAFNTMTERLLTTIGHLEHEKDFVRNAIESLTHPFYVVDVNDYTIKLANSAANFGSFSPGATCYQLTHKQDHPCGGDEHPCVIREVMKTKKPVIVEHLHPDPAGKMATFEIYGYPIFDDEDEVIQVIEYNIDITEKKNLEAQLLQSQKLEALGSLTGGVAHDFNNYLTTIIGYSQMGLRKLPEDAPLRPRLETIIEAAQKAAALTKQLLAFSRKQVMEIKLIDLNTLIRNMVKMLDHLVGKKIEMKELLRDSIGTIKADSSQVEQIIMNLAVNARDAMADGGTLFFDEVADLPLHMQVKLLRAIQEKAIRPVGSASEVSVDVRILSATHKDLEQLVKEGKFRQDLYYRINVIQLSVPALRERTEDIPQLTEHTLNKLARQMALPKPMLNPEALDALCRYSFPGNVRELENILQRAMTLCEDDTIRGQDLQLPKSTADTTHPMPAPLDSGQIHLEEHLGEIEKRAIMQALEQTKFNKTAAAKLLGLSFRALRYRLKKLGLE